MEAASKSYVKGIWQRFSYLATWLPNTRLQLGDVGVQDGQAFRRVTSLKDLGIAFQVRTGADRVDFTYTSQSGVTIQAKAQGQVAAGSPLASAQAGISIEFGEAGAFLFQAVGCSIDEIEDKAAVGRAAIALFQQGQWEPDWAVVDTLVKADSATIVVSNSQDAGLDLSADVPVTIGDLAKADAGLAVKAQRGDVVRFIAARGLAPLFKLSRVQRPLLTRWFGGGGRITFGGPAVRTDDAPAPEAGNPLEQVGPAP